MQGALTYFHALRPAGRMANSVPDRVLNDLLSKLSAASMPAELLRTLMLMKSDFMRLPPVDTDETGRSFLTLWLANRHLSAPPSAPAPGLEGGLGTPGWNATGPASGQPASSCCADKQLHYMLDFYQLSLIITYQSCSLQLARMYCAVLWCRLNGWALQPYVMEELLHKSTR